MSISLRKPFWKRLNERILHLGQDLENKKIKQIFRNNLEKKKKEMKPFEYGAEYYANCTLQSKESIVDHINYIWRDIILCNLVQIPE